MWSWWSKGKIEIKRILYWAKKFGKKSRETENISILDIFPNPP